VPPLRRRDASAKKEMKERPGNMMAVTLVEELARCKYVTRSQTGATERARRFLKIFFMAFVKR
jgi:hypothetical protein